MSEADVLDTAESALLELGFLSEPGSSPVEAEVAPTEGLPEGDTPEPTIDASGRAHGPDGKFIPKPEEGEETEEDSQEGDIHDDSEDTPDSEDVNEAEEPEAPDDGFIELDIDDPDVVSFLEKYDGDVVAALKAATEAQSLIGRQGQELGERRRESEELSQVRLQLEEMQRQVELTRAVGSIDWAELISEDPEKAANYAVELRDPIILEKVMESWKEESPFDAMLFMQNLAARAAEEAVARQQDSPKDLAGEVEALKQRYPDLQQTLPAIERMAAERPVFRQALNDGDPQSRAKALEDLYHLAKSQETPDTSTAKKIILKARAEADAAKADASVVSATHNTPPPAPPANPNAGVEEVLKDVFGDDFKVV